nr:DUF6502 family protein [Mangrovicoccus ximenensis]
MTDETFRAAVDRILRPLVRAMIGRGLAYPQLAELLKPLFIEQALRHFGLPGRRMTDSRISVLTGLQRRDIRSLREASEAPRAAERGHGPIPRRSSPAASGSAWRWRVRWCATRPPS